MDQAALCLFILLLSLSHLDQGWYWLFFPIQLSLTVLWLIHKLFSLFFRKEGFWNLCCYKMKRNVVNWRTVCALFHSLMVFLWHIQTMSSHNDNGGISFFWSWSYWSTFLLTWYAQFKVFVVICLHHFHSLLCTSNMLSGQFWASHIGLSCDSFFALSLPCSQTFLQDPCFEFVECGLYLVMYLIHNVIMLNYSLMWIINTYLII